MSILLKPFQILWKFLRLCGRLMGFQQKPETMNGHAYEKFVAQYLKEQGFRQVIHTGSTGDFGVDIVTRKHGIYYAVQCKFYSGSVSGAAVQEAVAGMAFYHCDRAMVVTNSGLTKGAKQLAAANHVLVMEYVVPNQVTVGGIATPERIISIAVCAVLSVWLLPQIRMSGGATAWWIYGIAIMLCYLLPRLFLAVLGYLWRCAKGRR